MVSARSASAICVAVASAALVALATPAAAARKPIVGKLSEPGYTVLALNAAGTATSDRAGGGRFRLRPPGERVTMHLRAPDGTYAGPIVVGRERKGERAILGLRAGARLGRVSVKLGRGYAKPERRLAAKWTDERRAARASKGVPIGAGAFGRVRSKSPRDAAPGDQDLDGIPEPLDIDDDGDLVLDNLETALTKGGTLRPQRGAGGAEFALAAFVHSPNPAQTVNANARDPIDPGAPAFSDAEIDASLTEIGDLLIGIVEGDSAELDCAGDPLADPPQPGLSYCSFPGTGRANHQDAPLPQQLAAFPGPPGNEFFDPDGDGFGSLVAFGPAPQVNLAHGATTAEIKTGDLLLQRVTTDGLEQQLPATVPEVLATHSALASYDDGAGNATPLSYPLEATGVSPGDAFPIADGPDESLDLTATVWRPQRRPTPSEPGHGLPGAWTDVGGMSYQLMLGGEWGAPGATCPQDSLSTADPELAPGSAPGPSGQAGGFTDLAPDRPADPANTLTYSVNLTRCIEELGILFPEAGLSWPQGEARSLVFVARAGRVATDAQIYFERQ